MKISFCGDTHGQFMAIDNLIVREKPDLVIQCGDFGIWNDKYGRFNKVKCQSHNRNVPVYFCRGNHENHDVLDTFPDFKISNLKNSERVIKNLVVKENNLSIEQWEILKNKTFPFADNFYLCESGSILSPAENCKILFIGGAVSTDRHLRKEHISWWKQETMYQYQIDYLLDLIDSRPSIDIVVSHTAPLDVVNKVTSFNSIEKMRDPTSKLLSVVHEKLHPKLWFFGHFHIEKTIKLENSPTVFHALNMSDIYKNGKYTKSFYHSVEI